MIRLATLIAVLVLAVAVYGRYQTENAVKARADDIASAERAIDRAEADIRTLRAEIAHLESPSRLAAAVAAKKATKGSQLRPATPSQVLSLEAALQSLTANADADAGGQALVETDPMAAFLEEYVVRAVAQDAWEAQ
ncbi:MAG: hypothetical protein AAGC95_08975 [Pseudomonadota bacterium]